MQHLVMLGAGYAHVHMLLTLAAQPLPDKQITLVSPSPRHLYGGMMADFVAGRWPLDDCAIALPPLLTGSGITWVQRNAIGLDAAAHSVMLDDGSVLDFDWLSINSEPVQNRQHIEQMIPGAREHALFARPLESFATLWPQVLAYAKNRALRVAVIGGGGTVGIELAMAVAHSLHGSSVTLLSGDAPVAANTPPAVQTRVVRALKDRNITLIRESAWGIAAGEVTLGSGTKLACDVPIIAAGAHAPPWLQGSGLDLDARGFVLVDEFQRSSSHPQVFAAADVSARVDQQPVRGAASALRAGSLLANNLYTVLTGGPPEAYLPPKRMLNFLACGDQTAIAHWGNYALQGRWAGWLKDRMDRNFIQTYRLTEPG